jgi:hypothetical protein
MIRVYRKRKDSTDSTDSEWHFHTQCSRWPETGYIQTQYVEVDGNQSLCLECVERETVTFGKPKF